MKDIHEQTYYELLEIEPSASQEEVLKAYNRARATYGHNSPALYSLFNQEEAHELLRLIDEAYAILSNQFKRKQYDTEKIMGAPESAAGTTFVNENDTGSFAIPNAGDLEQFKSGVREETISPPRYHSPQISSPPPRNPAPTRSPPGASTLSEGTTPFGQYIPDSKFEKEIKQAEEFPGAYLQKIRLYKNITLDQISEAVKISRSYLNAIESNNYSSLPAPVFVRGFVVQIAKVLGLDSNRVANSYMKLLRETQKK